MEDLWRKAWHCCLGLLDVTREEVAALVEEMVKRGELAEQDASKALDDIMAKAKTQQEAFMNKLAAMMAQVVSEAGLARAADLEALKTRVSKLEAGPVGGPG